MVLASLKTVTIVLVAGAQSGAAMEQSVAKMMRAYATQYEQEKKERLEKERSDQIYKEHLEKQKRVTKAYKKNIKGGRLGNKLYDVGFRQTYIPTYGTTYHHLRKNFYENPLNVAQNRAAIANRKKYQHPGEANFARFLRNEARLIASKIWPRIARQNARMKLNKSRKELDNFQIQEVNSTKCKVRYMLGLAKASKEESAREDLKNKIKKILDNLQSETLQGRKYGEVNSWIADKMREVKSL